jgi:hypothetical protein
MNQIDKLYLFKKVDDKSGVSFAMQDHIGSLTSKNKGNEYS